jgi:hypothetical protein
LRPNSQKLSPGRFNCRALTLMHQTEDEASRTAEPSFGG